MKEAKSGYKTSEMWIVAGSIAALAFGIPVTPDMAAGVIGVLGTVYTVVRGWVKANAK